MNIQIKRGGSRWTGVGFASGGWLRASPPRLPVSIDSVRVPSHLAFIRLPALELEGDLGQVNITCEEPPGDRAPRGAPWSQRFRCGVAFCPALHPQGLVGGVPGQDRVFLPSPSKDAEVGLLGTPPLPRRLHPPCVSPKHFPFVIPLFLKKNEILQP